MAKRMMKSDEFKKFFDDVINAVLVTKSTSKSLWEVMEENGLSPELPPAVADKIIPMLKRGAGGRILHYHILHNIPAL